MRKSFEVLTLDDSCNIAVWLYQFFLWQASCRHCNGFAISQHDDWSADCQPELMCGCTSSTCFAAMPCLAWCQDRCCLNVGTVCRFQCNELMQQGMHLQHLQEVGCSMLCNTSAPTTSTTTSHDMPACHLCCSKPSFVAMQVSVDNIDADLFGRGVRGGSFQPSDDTMHLIKSQAIVMLHDAYDQNMVRLQLSRHYIPLVSPWLPCSLCMPTEVIAV